MSYFDNIDKSAIESQFIYDRQPPIFDMQLFNQQKQWIANQDADPQALSQNYFLQFQKWIENSKFNSMLGLNTFPQKDFCVGVTGFIDDLYIQHGDKLKYIKGEYAYHRRLQRGQEIDGVQDLKAGDHFIISAPFCYSGSLHPQMQEILDHCNANNVNLYIDSAWYGIVKNFKFNYDQPCIKGAAFSLSKGLSLGHCRIGIRFAREKDQGPITIVNEFNMANANLMWFAIEVMKNNSCDYMQTKYGSLYDSLVQKMNLTPCNAIHIAKKEDGTIVGFGHVLKKAGLDYL